MQNRVLAPGLRLLHDGRIESPGTTRKRSRRTGIDALAARSRTIRRVRAARSLPYLYGPAKFDVLHCPATVIPSSLRRTSLPTVLSFWDMQHESMPQFFTGAELAWRQANYRPSVLRADAVVTPTEFIAYEVRERYGKPKESVQVIPPGIDPIFLKRDSSGPDTVRDKYRLSRQYFFYPGNTWHHKNHLALVSAHGELVREHGFDGHLVLSGFPGSAHQAVLDEISRQGLESTVRWLGYIPREDLPGLYQGARALVFPSLHEGFGIPLIEAMASGCPIACSSSTSIPEVVRDAGLFFQPEDPGSITKALLAILNDASVSTNLRARGLDRAASFTWKEAVDRLLDIYQRLALRR